MQNTAQTLGGIKTATFYRADLVYDGKQRMRKRTEYALSGGSWSWISDTYYIYDGMCLLQERDIANTPLATYTRGNDLSGSLEGAGGWTSQALQYRSPNELFRFAKCSGGLLARSTGYGSGSAKHFYHADANGNITAMVDSTQALSATYRYDSYGNLLSSSGSMAGVNLFRFSSKMQLSSSVILYYYGYRFYDPNLQRWPNRDPIAEKGHAILRNYKLVLARSRQEFTFVENKPNYKIDAEGLNPIAGCMGGGTVGAIGGFVGGIGSAIVTGCWRPVTCGFAGGAASGCVQGAACSTPIPGLCAAGSCLGGVIGSVVEQACNGSLDLKNPCSQVTAVLNTAAGCVGGLAEISDSAKAKIIQFVVGVDVSSIGNICQ